jgi:two-component system sensor histidine kinase CiaH
MFESTRLKLTAQYLVIIMLISVLFSIAFYHASTREIQRFIDRLEFEQQHEETLPTRFLPRSRNFPSVEELRALKTRSLLILIVANGVILIIAGGAGYFLAGRTLRPIKLMIDEQNFFISNASHEFRTPLATLRAEMEGSLLEKQISDKKARQLIKSNLEEVSTLQELSNSLLRLTRVHTINDKKAAADTSLTEVVKLASKKVKSLARQKGISLIIEGDEAVVHVTAPEIIEAVVILLDNAIKYSPAKSVVRISVKKNDLTAVISVSDQGVGISPADVTHIFKRFYRADKSRSQADGYGLGLSIAKRIVESYGGSISVQSRLSKGSTFAIQLPLSIS